MSSSSEPLFPLGHPQKLLEAILNAGNDYVCVKDRECRFVYSNELDASLYNAKPEEMLGKTTEPWVGKEQCEKWNQEDLAVLNSGCKKHYEPYSRTGPDGKTHWLYTIKIPFTDEVSGQELLLIIHRDITAIKEAELERDSLREQVLASQRMETIGLLSASVAHDFNNMLNVILTSADVLTGRHNLDAEALFLAKSITTSAKRAAEIVSTLLILSRREKIEHSYLDLKPCLQETQTMLKAVLGERIGFTMDLSPESLSIKGDGTMIEQVLINLVLNARDALPNGGLIGVKAYVSAEEDGSECVILEVSDNGIGMSPETLKKAFEPFYTTKPVGQGSGLGLVVVQRIMELHHGKIEVESRPGEGTRFVLKFPKIQGKVSVHPPSVAEAQVTLEGKTVLLVEDEELVRELICISLYSIGVNTVLATNGDEAWKILTESGRKIDCVLTDIVMGGELDGVSLRKKIFEFDPKIPVMLMTGYSFNYFQDHGISPAATEVLHKPFALGILREKLLRLMAD